MTMLFSAVGCIITLTISLLVAPLAAEAQSRITVPRIGYIGDTPGPYVDAFRQGLHERGYIEGETIAIEYRWQEGRHERLPDLVAELVQLGVEVLVPVGTQPSRAAKQATSTIPIVMAQVGDPVGRGLVAKLAEPCCHAGAEHDSHCEGACRGPGGEWSRHESGQAGWKHDACQCHRPRHR